MTLTARHPSPGTANAWSSRGPLGVHLPPGPVLLSIPLSGALMLCIRLVCHATSCLQGRVALHSCFCTTTWVTSHKHAKRTSSSGYSGRSTVYWAYNVRHACMRSCIVASAFCSSQHFWTSWVFKLQHASSRLSSTVLRPQNAAGQIHLVVALLFPAGQLTTQSHLHQTLLSVLMVPLPLLFKLVVFPS